MGKEDTREQNANKKEPWDFVCSSQFTAQRQQVKLPRSSDSENKPQNVIVKEAPGVSAAC